MSAVRAYHSKTQREQEQQTNKYCVCDHRQQEKGFFVGLDLGASQTVTNPFGRTRREACETIFLCAAVAHSRHA